MLLLCAQVIDMASHTFTPLQTVEEQLDNNQHGGKADGKIVPAELMFDLTVIRIKVVIVEREPNTIARIMKVVPRLGFPPGGGSEVLILESKQ